MAFDQRQLRVFLAVADTGSLGRAAATVHISQPALSRMIAAMEARIGQRLFERESKGMVPTAAGETLIPHARLLLFEMEQAIDALDGLRGLRRGVVRIGAVATITRSILPEAIARLLLVAPELHVSLLERPEGELAAALERREIDLMITPPQPPGDDLAMLGECRYDDAYAAFCAAGDPIARGPAPALAALLGRRWVMPGKGTTPRASFEQIFHDAGLPVPDIAVETESLSAMVAIVARGDLLGWLPQPLIARDAKAGIVRMLAVPELSASRRFLVYRRSRGLLPYAAQRMLSVLPLVDREGAADQASVTLAARREVRA